MAVTLVNPEGLPKVDLYRQVSVGTGSKMIFVAGQVAVDAEGATVGVGDLAAQVEQCYLNVATALAAVGGSFDDVARLSVYVVDWTPDKMPLLGEGIARATARLGVEPLAPFTGLGVSALAGPDLLASVCIAPTLPIYVVCGSTWFPPTRRPVAARDGCLGFAETTATGTETRTPVVALRGPRRTAATRKGSPCPSSPLTTAPPLPRPAGRI